MEGHISLTLRISILKPCDSMNCNSMQLENSNGALFVLPVYY